MTPLDERFDFDPAVLRSRSADDLPTIRVDDSTRVTVTDPSAFPRARPPRPSRRLLVAALGVVMVVIFALVVVVGRRDPQVDDGAVASFPRVDAVPSEDAPRIDDAPGTKPLVVDNAPGTQPPVVDTASGTKPGQQPPVVDTAPGQQPPVVDTAPGTSPCSWVPRRRSSSPTRSRRGCDVGNQVVDERLLCSFPRR